MRAHVRKAGEVLRRLARQVRKAAPEVVRLTARRASIRSRAKRTRTPKTSGEGNTVARLLFAAFFGQKEWKQRGAAKAIIAVTGSLKPAQLSAAHAIQIDENLANSAYQRTTKAAQATAIRQLLRWLWENHGAPKLDQHIRHYKGVRPRNVIADREEIDALLTAAEPHLKLWILLCSDLAIRSGTAARLGPAEYHPETAELRFTTKHGARLTLPVTQEIKALIECCDLRSPEPFVLQLWPQRKGHQHNPNRESDHLATPLRAAFQQLCGKVGIAHRIVPHDLRRTTAVAMLEQTHDVRDVQAILGHRSLQSTIWYLDHDLRPVKRSTLEMIKRPAWARKEQIA